MTETSRAAELARTMVGLGREHGLRVVALLTAMDAPLGRAVGNALEVAEAVEVLSGGGPADLVEVTLALAREMLDLAGFGAVDPAEALRDGSALERFRAMVVAQGGDPDTALARAAVVDEVVADRSGYLARLDARAVGVASWRLGAGRARKEDPVSPSAGVICRVKPGDAVVAGQTLLELHTEDDSRIAGARASLVGAFDVAESPPVNPPVVLERII